MEGVENILNPEGVSNALYGQDVIIVVFVECHDFSAKIALSSLHWPGSLLVILAGTPVPFVTFVALSGHKWTYTV